jgi:hypothetical protein
MQPKLMLSATMVFTLLSGSRALASPVVVECGPGQHTVVRDAIVRGEAVTRVACVGRAYRAPLPLRSSYETRDRYRRPYRSWGKSALIIGGSAGSGAGVGGIIGGKKGALIGAAVGGGVGSLYEGAHRR